jgi:HTH-type transcriptional regulator, competence development regulator
LRLLSGRSGRISLFDEWEMNMAKTFGQRLQELRREAGISQRDLAAQTGVDFSYISKVENDRLPPPAADTVVKICAILQVPSDELLALTGKVPSDVKEMLGSSSSAQQFIRQAQEMNLSDQEWQLMTKRLKKLRA